jgi:hypothetical protein
MDNFEKIELIVNGRLKEGKAELDRVKRKDPYGANTLYILGVEHEVNMLTRIALDIKSIREKSIQ